MNVFNFTGNLGKDCRVGNVGGTAVVNFNVAVKSGYGQNEKTLWVDCSLWGKQAESKLPDYLLKGQQVAISGELGDREYEGKTYLTCRVSSISLIGKRDDSRQGQSGQQQPSEQSTDQAKQQNNPMAEPDFDFDDDIPF